MGKISPERIESNAILRAWCAGVTGDVLSIGSAGDIDKEGKTYREYFRNATSYTTSDIEPGAEIRLDIRQTGLPDACYDAVFCSGVLEHVDDCHLAVSEIHRILRPNGLLLVGVPFMQPLHRAPEDYWRFTEFGLRWLLRAFDVLDVVPLGTLPYGYWCRARRGQ